MSWYPELRNFMLVTKILFFKLTKFGQNNIVKKLYFFDHNWQGSWRMHHCTYTYLWYVKIKLNSRTYSYICALQPCFTITVQYEEVTPVISTIIYYSRLKWWHDSFQPCFTMLKRWLRSFQPCFIMMKWWLRSFQPCFTIHEAVTPVILTLFYYAEAVTLVISTLFYYDEVVTTDISTLFYYSWGCDSGHFNLVLLIMRQWLRSFQPCFTMMRWWLRSFQPYFTIRRWWPRSFQPADPPPPAVHRTGIWEVWHISPRPAPWT